MRSAAFNSLNKESLARIDAICDQFERNWERARISIEEAIGEVDANIRSAALIELVLLEWELLTKSGQAPSVNDYESRFPNHATDIRLNLAHAGLVTGTSPSGSNQQGAHDPSANSTRTNQISRTNGSGKQTPARESYRRWVGQTIGNYKLLECLGAGGMGAVFRAEHTMIRCERAVKVLLDTLAENEFAVCRFLQEAQAGIEHLKHDNIVTTYDVNQDGQTVYLVMELLDGKNLYDLVMERGALEIVESVSIIRQASEGLAFAHEKGLIHRDIKPHNIMLTDVHAVKLLDFGLVRVLGDATIRGQRMYQEEHTAPNLSSMYQSRMTGPDSILGTAAYMSPEQYENAADADRRSDVYSLGCTLYFLLTGRHAFAADTMSEVLQKHQDSQYEPAEKVNPSVPPNLSSLVDRMLTRSREDRIQSARDVVDILDDWRIGKHRRIRISEIDELRDGLIELGVITREEWDLALTRLKRDDPPMGTLLAQSKSRREWGGNKKKRLFKKRKPITPPTIHAAQILSEIQRMSHRRKGHAGNSVGFGLTEYQLRSILSENADQLRIPSHIILDQIGSGWKGDVFLARHETSREREVVRIMAMADLKGIPGPVESRKIRFELTAKELRELQIERMAKVLGYDSYEHRDHGQMVCLTSEYIPGLPLHDYVANRADERRPLNYEWVLGEVSAVGSAMDVAHSQGFLHLDLGNQTLRVTETDQLVITDLGIAGLVREHHNWDAPPKAMVRGAGGLEGMAAFEASIAPEPAEGIRPPESIYDPRTADPLADVFGLGCVLYWLLTGSHLDSAIDPMKLLAHPEPKPILSRATKRLVPSVLHNILEKALATNPNDRFSTMGEFAAAIDSVRRKNAELCSKPVRWMK